MKPNPNPDIVKMFLLSHPSNEAIFKIVKKKLTDELLKLKLETKIKFFGDSYFLNFIQDYDEIGMSHTG